MPSAFSGSFTDGQQITVDGKLFEYVLASNLFKNVTVGGGSAVPFQINILQSSAFVSEVITVDRSLGFIDFTAADIAIAVTVDGITASFTVVDSNTLSVTIPASATAGTGKIVSVSITPTGESPIVATDTITIQVDAIGTPPASGFIHWWEAYNLTGQTNNAALAGTVPDSIGAVALNTTAAPIYLTSGVGAKPSLSFNGSSHFLKSASNISVQNPYIFLVTDVSSVTSLFTELSPNTNTNIGFYVSNTTGSSIQSKNSTGAQSTSNTSAKNAANSWASGACVIAIKIGQTHAETKLWKNGSPVTLTTDTSYAANIGTVTFTNILYLFSRAGSSLFMTGQLAAVGIVPGTANLSDSQVTAISNTLKTRYGI